MKATTATTTPPTATAKPTVQAFATKILHDISELNEHAGELAKSINGMVSSTTSERRERQFLKEAIGKEQDIDGSAAQAALMLCNHIKTRLYTSRLPESTISDETEELATLDTRYRMFFKIAVGGKDYSLQSRKGKGYIWAEPTSKNKNRTTNTTTPPAKKPVDSGKGSNPDTTSPGRVSERQHEELATEQVKQITSGGTAGEVVRGIMSKANSTERVAIARNVLDLLTMDEWKEISILLEKAEFTDKKETRAAEAAMQAAA